MGGRWELEELAIGWPGSAGLRDAEEGPASSAAIDHDPRREEGKDGGGLEGPATCGFRGSPMDLVFRFSVCEGPIVVCEGPIFVCEGPIVNGVIRRSFGPGCGGPNGPGALPRSCSRPRPRSLRCSFPDGSGSSFPSQKADIPGEAVCFCVGADNSMISVGAPERGRRCSNSRKLCGLSEGLGGPGFEPKGSPVMGGACALLGPLNPC